MLNGILILFVICMSCCPAVVASCFAFVSPSHHEILTRGNHNVCVTPNNFGRGPLPLFAETSSQSEDPPTPLCDLQTFLRLTSVVKSGGEAKTVIQKGECFLNGDAETRRAKKLFKGDEVCYKGICLDVLDEVRNKGYVFKPKQKKIKPVAKVMDADGTLEFGGRYRSEEWRAERKAKKADRKASKENE